MPVREAFRLALQSILSSKLRSFFTLLGIIVSVRKSRGRDIRAACGQLAVEGRKQSPAQRLADQIQGTC